MNLTENKTLQRSDLVEVKKDRAYMDTDRSSCHRARDVLFSSVNVLALAILFHIVLLYVLDMLGCVYVWTVVSAGYPALLFQLIVLCTVLLF